MACQPYVFVGSNALKGTKQYFYLSPRFEAEYLGVALRGIMLEAVGGSRTVMIEIKLVCDGCGTCKVLATEFVSRGIYSTASSHMVDGGNIEKALDEFIHLRSGEIVADVVNMLRNGEPFEQQIKRLRVLALGWLGRKPQNAISEAVTQHKLE